MSGSTFSAAERRGLLCTYSGVVVALFLLLAELDTAYVVDGARRAGLVDLLAPAGRMCRARRCFVTGRAVRPGCGGMSLVDPIGVDVDGLIEARDAHLVIRFARIATDRAHLR